MIKTIGDLRTAIEGLDDTMRILLRVRNEDGNEQMICVPSSAKTDTTCIDVFLIDGTDGQCPHGSSGYECLDCKAEYDRN